MIDSYYFRIHHSRLIPNILFEKDTIPIYNNNNNKLKPGTLVRMKGFVQDMFDAEYFSYVNNSNNMQGELGERTPLLIAPLPYTTEWYRGSRNATTTTPNDDTTVAPPPGKRPKPNHPIVQNVWFPGTLGSDPCQTPLLALCYSHNPTHPQNHHRVHLNNVVDVIGVLEYDDDDDDDDDVDNNNNNHDEDEAMAQEYNMDPIFFGSTLPSSRILPRIHVVSIERVSLYQHTGDEVTQKLLDYNHSLVSLKQASTWIFQHLGVLGNSQHVVGTAVWMTLFSRAERDALSRVPKQTPQGSTVGTASLHLVLPDEPSCSLMKERLMQLLTSIAPVVVPLNFHRQHSSSLSLPSKMDGRLNPISSLQLPQGAVVVVDLSSNVLPQGSALQTLQQLISTHSVPYLFEGNVHISFEADVSIIVLSTPAQQRLVSCDWTLPIVVQSLSPNVIPLEASLALRNHLWTVLREPGGNINLPPDLLSAAEQDFLHRRSRSREKKDAALPGEIEFHRWLTLTRMMARMRGAPAAQREDWAQALEIDDAIQAACCS